MVPEKLQSPIDIESKLKHYEYMSHWRPLSYFTSKCTSTKPYIKLKKFPQSKFTRKHEHAMNHIFIQRMYLIALAMHYRVRLELSDNFYEEDGLVYGVYQFYQENYQKSNNNNNGTGIKMREQVQFDNVLSFLDIVQLSFKKYCKFLEDFNLQSQGEYDQFIHYFTSLYDNKSQDTQPLILLSQIERRPLIEHYTFNVKLKNAMLLPNIIKDKEILQKYCALVKNQKMLMNLAIEQPNKQPQILEQFQNMVKQILQGLEKNGKIVQLRMKNMNKIKAKQFKICISFRVILSVSRSQIIVNETPIGEGEQQELQFRDPAIVKKIQIKPSNSSISPVSGNIISASSVWQLNPTNGFISCRVSCYNNRKVMQSHFEQIQNFWHQLTSSQQYHQIIGTDKFTISHNLPRNTTTTSLQSSSTTTQRQKQKQRQTGRLEVTFTNFVHGCLISEIIKEIDKVMVLAISMDQIIQKGQRKGFEHQDPNNWEIQKYMVREIRDKIRVALDNVQKSSKQIKKYTPEQ